MTNVLLLPLTPFGPVGEAPFELDPEVLRPGFGTANQQESQRVADYLRDATMVLALMEFTRDVIGSAFGVAGGSAVMTDGRYYWRLDAAEYVLHYGIAVDAEARDWMMANDWTPPAVPHQDLIDIDAYLARLLMNAQGQ